MVLGRIVEFMLSFVNCILGLFFINDFLKIKFMVLNYNLEDILVGKVGCIFLGSCDCLGVFNLVIWLKKDGV